MPINVVDTPRFLRARLKPSLNDLAFDLNASVGQRISTGRLRIALNPLLVDFTGNSVIKNILRFTPSNSVDVAYHRLYYVVSSGNKTWTSSDLSLPFIRLDPVTPSGDGKYEYNLADFGALSGLKGTYDIAVTAVDTAGNDSGENDDFLEVEDAIFNF